MVITATAFLSFSCSSEFQENENGGNTGNTVVTATQETLLEDGNVFGQTRTSLTGGTTVTWNEGDLISMYDGTSNIKYEVSKGGATCTFHTTGDGVSGSANRYTAFYPYDMNVTFSDNTISHVTLPANQEAVENGFDPTCNLMTASAKTISSPITFKHVCSYLKFVPDFDCERVVFTFGDNDAVAGTFDISVGDDGTPSSISNLSDKSNSITLVGDITKGKTYYIAVLPGTYSNGFKVTLEQKVTKDCVDTERKVVNTSVCHRETTKALTSTRARIKSLGTLNSTNTIQDDDFSVKYVDLGYGDDWNAPSGTKVLWAKCNLGAKSETESGNYYAWGEVSPKDTYTSTNYLCNDYYPVTLDDTHDAATVNLGHGWRTPSCQDYLDLKHNTIWVLTSSQLYIYPSGTVNGKTVKDCMQSNGVLNHHGDGYEDQGIIKEEETDEDIINYVKGLSTANSIYMYIPLAGHKSNNSISTGCVRTWMNTRSTDGDGSHANYLGVWNGGNGINLPSRAFPRYCGMPIRPCITIKWKEKTIDRL